MRPFVYATTRPLGEQRRQGLFVLLRSRCGATDQEPAVGFQNRALKGFLTCFSLNGLPQSDKPCSVQSRLSSSK